MKSPRFPFSFVLIALPLLAMASAQASTIECDVEFYAPAPLQFGKGEPLKHISILHAPHQPPILKTQGNRDLIGTVAADPQSGKYTYQFGTLYTPHFQGDGHCGDSKSSFEENAAFIYDKYTSYGKREALILQLDLSNPNKSQGAVHVEVRQRPTLFSFIRLGADWYNQSSSEPTMFHCMIRK